MDESIEMDSSGFGQGYYQKIKDVGKLKDFVVQTRITWDSSGALSGCGYLYRAPSDWDLNTGDWYELIIIRVQFAPAWVIAYYKDGYLQYNMPGGAGVKSKNLLDTKRSTNTLTLDAHGDKFTVYINGVKERTIENDRGGRGRPGG